MAAGWMLGGRRAGIAASLLGTALATVLHVPQALAFPHAGKIGATTILSDRPIMPEMAMVLARADRLVAASPLAGPGIARTLVLTDGGWRWRVPSLGAGGAIALRRPFSPVLLFNRSDVARDRVTNGAAIGGVRTLSGTIAHETTHLLVAQRLGELRAAMLPAWKREGYADFVAGETGIGADDERRIRSADPDAPVLLYHEGRRRVERELARNGGSVEALFD